MSEKTNIQKLLKLKRYEQPPAGYYDRFLSDFQRRQRLALMKKPGIQTFFSDIFERFSEFRVGPIAYACTIAIAIGVSIHFLNPSSAPNVAANTSVASATTTSQRAAFSPVTIPSNMAKIPVSASSRFSPTHYVLDSHPVNHEHPFEF